MNSTLSTYIMLYSAVLIIAANGLFAKGIPLDAGSITFLRSFVAMVGLGIAALLLKRSKKIHNRLTLLGVYSLGVLLGLHWVTFFHSMQVSTIAIGVVSLFTFPIMTIFMEGAVHKKWPHWLDLFAALAVLIGTIIMIADEPLQLTSSTLQGVLYGLLSAFLFATRNVCQKYYFDDITSDTLMFHQMIAIVIVLALFIDYPSIGALSTKSWLAILALGLISTAIAHTLNVISYKRLPAKTVAMISCIQPVAAALLAWFFINEKPTLFIIIGGGIVLSVAIYESIARSQRA